MTGHSTRARWRQRRSTAEPSPAVIRPGLRLPRHRATTAHVCALYPFHADEGLGPHGIYLGEDVSAGGSSWHYDVFQLYTDGVITSPNIVVLGMVGAGKSSAVKTLLYRTVGMLGADGKPRWCAILDPKGEYGPLAQGLGLQTPRAVPRRTDKAQPTRRRTLCPIYRRAPSSADPDGCRTRLLDAAPRTHRHRRGCRRLGRRRRHQHRDHRRRRTDAG